MKKLLVSLALFALTPVLSAAIITQSGPGVSIPDNDPTGVTTDIVIGDPRLIVGNLEVTLHGFLHTWVGDLIGTLTHVETGTSQTLFHRIGRTGGTGLGDASDFTLLSTGAPIFGARPPLWG